MSKIALLVGISEYQEGLEALPSAVKDVAALQQVLVNPDMGGFDPADVTVLPNPDRQLMSDAIYLLFANRQKDDLVLLYFSGHGILDDANEFYFSTRITRKVAGKLLPTTALPANDIRSWMEQSKSQRKVIILDSCFSGAFAKGVKIKDSGSINPENFLGGQGTAILTASTSTQYAMTQDGFDLSIYTHYLVEGIRTGGADRDNDGLISVAELHAYAKDKVQAAAPAMTPEFYPFRDGGHTIVIAQAPTNDPHLRYRKAAERKVRQGRFSKLARRSLDALQVSLPIIPEIAAAIEAEVLKPYQDFQRKLTEYEAALLETVQEEALLDERVLADLKEYQTQLGLRDEDVQPITDRILNPHRADHASTPVQSTLPSKGLEPNSATPLPLERSPILTKTVDPPSLTFKFEIATVDASLQITRHPGSAEFVRETLGGVALDLVQIPGGRFGMGAARAELGARGVESPLHQVTVPPFALGKYPVTQAQWTAVAALPKIQQDLNPSPSRFKGPNRPVEQITWWEAIEFCDRLAQQTGRAYRLPSEAEWEYACRSGTLTPFHFGETLTPDLANYRWSDIYGEGPTPPPKDFKGTTPVGQFGVANAFGLYDMHGNVWEWCADHWHGNYEDAPTDGSAWLSTDPSANGVLRGGAWDYSPQRCRSAYRDSIARDYRSDFLGFRVSF